MIKPIFVQDASQMWSEDDVGGGAAFKAGQVQEVEFEVRVGPAEFATPKGSKNQNDNFMLNQKMKWNTQNCKIVCKRGQWIGPLCRDSDGK